MAAVSLPEEQLLELLTQLQKTTPEQIRAILNPQPAIANGLLKLMIKMDLIKADSLMQHLSGIAGATPGRVTAPTPTPAIPAPTPAVAPTPAASMPHPPFLPPHLAQQAHMPSHTPTPPLMPPGPPVAPPYHQYGAMPPGPPPPNRPGSYPPLPGLSMPPPPHLANMGYHTPPPPLPPHSAPPGLYHQQQQQPGGYPPQAQAPPPPTLPPLPDAFAHLPEDQKATIRHVMSMTPAQVQQLPPAERASIVQLVSFHPFAEKRRLDF